MEWNDGLPDASAWQPRSDKAPALDNGLLLTCKAIQSRIVREAEIEKKNSTSTTTTPASKTSYAGNSPNFSLTGTQWTSALSTTKKVERLETTMS